MKEIATIGTGWRGQDIKVVVDRWLAIIVSPAQDELYFDAEQIVKLRKALKKTLKEIKQYRKEQARE